MHSVRGGAHPKSNQVTWKKRPLFRRKEEGGAEGFFRTGAEAADMLFSEAERVGPHEGIFLDTVRDVLDSVAPVIDRWPQYAWVAKQLLEAERVGALGAEGPRGVFSGDGGMYVNGVFFAHPE